MDTLIRRIRVAIAQTLREEPDLDPEMVKKVAELMRLIDSFETQFILENELQKAA